jgi:TRAP-type C4-dicarboxylate transport system permease small subunit
MSHIFRCTRPGWINETLTQMGVNQNLSFSKDHPEDGQESNGAHMKALMAIDKYLNYIASGIVILFVAIMSVSVFYGIVCRYIFNAAPFWPEEVARFMMVYMALIGAGIAFRRREHVGLGIILDRLCPVRWRRWVIAMTDVLTLIFFGFVIVYGIKFAVMGIHIVSPATQMMMALPYAGVPIGCTFCFVQVLINLFRDVRKAL